MLCANARLNGHPVAVIANRRGFLRRRAAHRRHHLHRIRAQSGLLRRNSPSAWACRSSICRTSPASWSALEAEREGIIRAGAEMVESMSCATVPNIVLTINHASGAGYYAMAGQGFDPNFTFSWPTARIGVMEGDSAVQALFSVELEKLKTAGAAAARRACRIHRTNPRRLRTLARREVRRRPRPLRRHHRSQGNPRGADSGPRSRDATPRATRSLETLDPDA